MSMEMNWKINEDGSMEHIFFQGLNGTEFTSNLKSAMEQLKIKNPTSTFSARVKTGEFDTVMDHEFEQIVDEVKYVSTLWHYPDAGEDELAQCEMNVLMLLANAIEVISRQHVTISMLRAECDTAQKFQ